MVNKKFSAETIGAIKELLKLKWSFRTIIKHFKKQNVSISIGYLSKIKNRKENSLDEDNKPSKTKKKPGPQSLITKPKLARLKKMVTSTNPPTQIEMAKRLNVSKTTINSTIKKKLNLKSVKKPKCHHLSPDMIEKRRKRAWPMYRRLRENRWRKVITTDEAWFYLTNCNGKTRIQYISREKTRSVCEPYISQSHPKGFMVWAGISSSGVTQLRFVKPGAKINSDYYIEKILKPFLRKDLKILYPNGDYALHQDSAPSHRSKKTIKYLQDNKVIYITPEQWMPNSPDAAPCDFFLWGILKNVLIIIKLKLLMDLKMF